MRPRTDIRLVLQLARPRGKGRWTGVRRMYENEQRNASTASARCNESVYSSTIGFSCIISKGLID